jgi:hypothetical protein
MGSILSATRNLGVDAFGDAGFDIWRMARLGSG